MHTEPGAPAPTPRAAARSPDSTQVVALASGGLLALGSIALQAAPERGAEAAVVLLAAAALVAASIGVRAALAALRGGRITAELLVAIVVVAALASGDAFAAAGVAFVGVVGRWLELRLRARFAAADEDGARTGGVEARRPASLTRHALSLFAGWYTPLTIALAAGSLAVTDDVGFALTLLLVASPLALLVVAARRDASDASHACAALFAVVLLGAALAGVVGAIAVAVLQQASALAARLALAQRSP